MKLFLFFLNNNNDNDLLNRLHRMEGPSGNVNKLCCSYADIVFCCK